MMRKTIFAILTICGLAGMLLGCSNLVDNPQDSSETGIVLVQVGTAGMEARTVGPNVEAFAEYKLTFEKGQVVIPELMTPSENGKAFNLEPGTWTLGVTGFIDVAGEKRPAVSGSATITVAAGKTVQAKVTLTDSEPDTYGTFDYSAIDLSQIGADTLKTATMTITPSDPNRATVTFNLLNEKNDLELPAGLYTILVELTSGRSIAIKGFKHELNAYREETVYIYPYMTTALRAGEYAFTEEDFIADLYFTGTAVIDPYSTGTDTYKATKVHILKAVDNDRNMIANDQQDFESQLITEASIDDNGNWELYLPSNLIADDIKAPFTFFTDGKYHRSAGYPVYFSFTMQSQQNPANTMQSRWVRQEIVNKHGKRDIALEAKIRKITIQGNWGTVEGNSAIRTSAGYDVVYADDLDNRIILTVNTANSGIMRDTVKVKKSGGDDLTVVEDELDVVSNPESVFITFKMPDDDVTVSAQFFIPEGNVLVHAADNSSGGYTARQVFVWLDANQDGKPDSDLPVNRGPDGRSDDYVNGGEWKFTLPSEHQAYSGAFLFQFRLTRTGKSDILSRQFPVNVSELASDIDNRISLPVEIRTLVTDTAGKGNITITVPNMRGEDGNLVESPSIASGDYAAVDTDLRVTVIPTGADYLSGLHYAQTGSLNGTPAELYASGDGGKIYAFTMPSYNTTVTAEFRDFAVGDTGPAGGLIFYVEQNGSQVTSQGWKYLEAAPTDALSPYAESGTISWMSLPYSEPGYPQSYYLVDTYSYIGAGKQNTVNMIQAVVTGGGEFLYSYFENGAAKACDIFTYDGYEDWFLPSKDDLAAMYTELKGNSLGNFTNGLYWSSTASDLENAYAIDFSSVENDPNDATETKEKHHEYLYVRPIRAF